MLSPAVASAPGAACGIGAPWNGQRPSLADYVMVTGLRLRLQRGCSVRGWGLTAWGRGLRSGGARAVGA
jgi:hypothetical protein